MRINWRISPSLYTLSPKPTEDGGLGGEGKRKLALLITRASLLVPSPPATVFGRWGAPRATV